MAPATIRKLSRQRHRLRLALGCALAVGASFIAACDEAIEPPVQAHVGTPAPQAARDGTVLHPVQWPAAKRLDTEARAALPAAARRAVAGSPVPVVVVAEPEWLRASRVMTKRSWYALAAHTHGLSLAIHGNHLAHRYAHMPPAQGPHRVRGEPAFITQNAGIWSATWLEHGVSYSLELECASPDDGRCSDDAELRRLTAQLRYVGGAGQGSTP